MSRLSGGRSITDRVIFRQDSPPAVTDSVVWIDTSGEQPQAKIYDPAAVEWLSVGVVDYDNLVNNPVGTSETGYNAAITKVLEESDEDSGSFDSNSGEIQGFRYSDGYILDLFVENNLNSDDVRDSVSVEFELEFYLDGSLVKSETYSSSTSFQSDEDKPYYTSVNVDDEFNTEGFDSIEWSVSTSSNASTGSEYSVVLEVMETQLPAHSHGLVT